MCLKTTSRYIISNVRIHKNHNTLQNFIPAFTSNTIDKYGIPIIKAEYYLMLYIYFFQYYANTYLNIKCPALSIALVRHAHITDRAPTYHSAAAPEHVHLVCRECGAVTEVTPQEVAPMTEVLQGRYGFATDIGHLTVFGTCRTCTA